MTGERAVGIAHADAEEPPALYTDRRTRLAISETFSSPKDIPFDDKDLHPRIHSDIPMSEIRYLGRWNHQNGERTCGVWATVNSIRAVGGRIDTSYVRDMLNFALENNGIAMEDTAKMANGRDLGVDIEFIEPYQSLEHLPLIPYSEDPLGEGIVAKNARFVAAHVSENSALMIRVPGLVAVNGIATKQPHRVSVVGYRVDERGYMDVQVVDSDKGVFYKGIESLSRNLFEVAAPALAVKKR